MLEESSNKHNKKTFSEFKTITKEKITGSGGMFNPIKEISRKRLSKSEIKIDEETKFVCEKMLGKDLYNYFLLNKIESGSLQGVLLNF